MPIFLGKFYFLPLAQYQDVSYSIQVRQTCSPENYICIVVATIVISCPDNSNGFEYKTFVQPVKFPETLLTLLTDFNEFYF